MLSTPMMSYKLLIVHKQVNAEEHVSCESEGRKEGKGGEREVASRVDKKSKQWKRRSGGNKRIGEGEVGHCT